MNLNSKNKILLVFVVFFLLLTTVWQFYFSKKVVVKDQKPMEVQLVLEPMNPSSTEIAEKSSFVYLGSSNKKITVKSYFLGSNNQLTLTLKDEGLIYEDSAFFGGQRLVYNTKIKVHALFDAVGTVTKIEYVK